MECGGAQAPWLALLLVLISICKGYAQNWTSLDNILTMSGVPAVTFDGRVYICVGKNLIVYNSDSSLNWTAMLRSGQCDRLIPPLVDSLGRVYLATQNYVQIVTRRPYAITTKKYKIEYFYNYTPNSLGSKAITGLSAGQSDAASTIYINTGVGGLYALTVEGTPRWTLGGSLNATDWQKTTFAPNDFCSGNSTSCYFHFSPAVDYCDGSIYIAHSNGWLYAIAGWQPFVRWRYSFGLTGEASQACVTAGNNGLVYVSLITQEMVYAIDRQTGDLIWKMMVGPMSRLTCFPRVDITGWVYIGSADGLIYAISPSGDSLKRLLTKSSQNSVIQAPPYLECLGGALYVAQVEVRSKLVSYGPPTIVSYTDALSVTVSQIDPLTGALFRKEVYSGPATFGGGCTLDSSLILALTSQTISISGPCKNAERSTAATCVGSLSLPGLPDMNNKKFEEYYISIPTLFAGIMLAALSMYAYWSRKKISERKKRRDERRKDLGIPKDKKKLAQRRAAIENAVADLREKYLSNPSPEVEAQLFELLNELSFLDMLIANQVHDVSSQHGLRRRLELGHYAAYSSGRNTTPFQLGGSGSPVGEHQEVIAHDAATPPDAEIAALSTGSVPAAQ